MHFRLFNYTLFTAIEILLHEKLRLRWLLRLFCGGTAAAAAAHHGVYATGAICAI